MTPTTMVTGMAMLRFWRYHDFAVLSAEPALQLPSLHLPPNPHGVPSAKVDWRITH